MESLIATHYSLLIIHYSLLINKKGDFFCETAFLFDSAALNQ